ncbi:MAG TPA: U32 family peptidase [Thermoguttaceae bacterium]|nr:U32 family peptidase [Thermoguttaceae bacterium]
MGKDGEATAAEDSRAATPGFELLAPAGDSASLEAALEAGADAVYFGLRALNARRGARNFTQDELAQAVESVHAQGARAYLTLNVDLAERELGLAARMLSWARQCGVDAVLVRDPALLALEPEYAELEFHFSTQSCMANSAEVQAAAALSIARVVLAREMTLAEIRAASAVAGVETEVFAQGALCFSVSGRCYLSSWGGGRSGNRGTCTSPCRVPWTADGVAPGTPFSMRDLLSVDRIGELREAGVAALKIEGRMKNAAWVRRAVALYRRALDGEEGPELREEAARLGAYTGRQLTSGYLDGRRDELTGIAGREASPEHEDQTPSAGPSPDKDDLETAVYDVAIQLGGPAIECRCTCSGRTESWSMPKTVVRRKHKAMPVGDLLESLSRQPIEGCRPGRLATDEPDYLLVPRAANKLIDRIQAVVRRGKRRGDELTGIRLPEGVRRILEKTEPHRANCLSLGSPPDRVRLDASAVKTFVRHFRPGAIIVEGLTEDDLFNVRRTARKIPLVVALPPVFFDDDVPGLEKLIRRCKGAGVPVEVNSWGGWMLARKAGVRMEGGPGLPVLNSLAARELGERGLRSVTLSVEADRRQMEDVTAHCPGRCSLVVFGRPPLLTSRVELREEDFRDRILVDRRGLSIRGRRERGLWVFRPIEPFDLRDVRNERVRAAHLVVDLVGSEDPAADFHTPPAPGSGPFRFNYDRSLV